VNRLDVVLAGRVSYQAALAWQRTLARQRVDRTLPHDLLLLLEHEPVITLGRTAQREHLLTPGDLEVVEVERGGDVTYHGPGQLVGYPIIDLTAYRQDLHWYLRTLEQALIAALGELGIPGERAPGYTGVWTRGRKIASIGVHVKQWVTWHGFALNVSTDLAAFDRIVPCGIAGVTMTSVEREGGGPDDRGRAPLWDRTVAAVVGGFARAFGAEVRLREPTAPFPTGSGLARESSWSR
jgi:lipoyl(octanoyl) transferase